ncbi:MAG: VOC family protein [Ilumatobacteraceae bacterium]
MTETQPLRVHAIDHIVLLTDDVEACVAWYRDELGMEPEGLDDFRAGRRLFPSMRVSVETIIDLVVGERTGENVNHFALVVDDDVDALAASGRFDLVGGPADLSGAQGVGRGIYIRDPAGNRVELRNYR